MKIIMYGGEFCPDCVEAKEKLATNTSIELDYRDITKSTTSLKEFLSYRDQNEIFAPIKKDGKIGIPFFVLEDQTETFEIYDFLGLNKPAQTANACSIDGKGQC